MADHCDATATWFSRPSPEVDMTILVASKRAARAVRLAFLTGIALLAFPVQADLVPIANSSFETLPAGGLPNLCGAGCRWAEDFIPGWENVPFAGLGLASGQWRPGTDLGNTTYFDSLSDGPTHAFSNGFAIVQRNVTVVQSGMVYTLRVEVGHRKDGAPTGLPSIRLGETGPLINATGTPTFGGWSTFTATYFARPIDVGQPIDIYLGAGGVQGNFDDVRLDVPEPGNGLAMGAVGLLLLCRSRARSSSAPTGGQ